MRPLQDLIPESTQRPGQESCRACERNSISQVMFIKTVGKLLRTDGYGFCFCLCDAMKCLLVNLCRHSWKQCYLLDKFTVHSQKNLNNFLCTIVESYFHTRTFHFMQSVHFNFKHENVHFSYSFYFKNWYVIHLDYTTNGGGGIKFF